MDIVANLTKKFKPSGHHIEESVILEMKTLYRMDNRSFVALLKRFLSDLNHRSKIGSFTQVYASLSIEIGNVAPFVAPELNRFFKLLYDIGFYKMIMEHLGLFQSAADSKTLMVMKELLTRKDIQRIYSGVEIYRLKKAVIELSGKFRSKKEVIENFDVHLAPLSGEWMDYPVS